MWIPLFLGIFIGVLALAGLLAFRERGLRRNGGLGGSELRSHADPQAQLNQALSTGLDAIAQAKTDLEAEKELVIASQRRVDQNLAEETRLTNRIKAALGDGDPHGAAKEYALSLAHVREQLASNNEQLARHKANYEAFAQKVEMGQRQVLEAKQKSRDLGIAVEESEREAKLSRFAEEIGGQVSGRMGDAMSRMQERIDLNKAKAAVANDLNQQPLAEAKDHATAEQAKADAILAEFTKKP